MIRFVSLLLIISQSVCAQTITSIQQNALNNYIDYANQSAEEVTSIVEGIRTYYPTIFEKNNWRAPRFVCPVQIEDYYFNKALAESKSLGAFSAALNAQLKELRVAAEKIDVLCKALDTYHKLEDYKQDNFKGAEKMINELQILIVAYKHRQSTFEGEVVKAYKKLNPNPSVIYTKADAMMRKQLHEEMAFVNLWMLNLKEEIHTGWIVDKLEGSILETDTQLKSFQNTKLNLGYPASSMWPSFQEGMNAIVEVKRRGWDEYNHEALKSDAHSNAIYLELINYINGVLVSNYNSFIDFSKGDKYYGLKAIKYVPSFEIRTQPQTPIISVIPFEDLPRPSISIVKQTVPIKSNVLSSLQYYVEFINETCRQVVHASDVIDGFNASAAYYKTLDSYTGHGGLTYRNEDFVLPLSYYQKAVMESAVLPPKYAESLNKQSEVILNTLKEMEQLSASLEVEVSEKRYEKDRLKKIYALLERNKLLQETWDEKKEILYNDLRNIFDSYPPANVSSAWYVSGKALRELVDLDHEGLFKAKSFYKGTSSNNAIATEEIDKHIREVIANEYTNMKGIEKIGRYNGLCPYTPYEDLPVNSKHLSEQLKKLTPPKKATYNNTHPYHAMVYAYNDVIENFNKFCQLSPMPFLKAIRQPELFAVQYPESKDESHATQTPSAIDQKPVDKVREPIQANNTTQSTNTIKVMRDTVYIEKHDTVYLSVAGEEIRSMEGYAINNMILLLDVSGSMNAPEKLPLLKTSVLNMVSMMREEDQVSILIFSGKPKVILSSSSFKEEEKIKKAISALKPSGKTDGNAGLKLAYKIADENYKRGGNNRIVLATDGEFPITQETLDLIQQFSKDDIFLSVFNFGKSTASAKTLETLALTGKGNYEYISKENVELKLIREVKAKRLGNN